MEFSTSTNVDISKFLALDESKATTTKMKWKCSDFVVKMLEEGVHTDITFKAKEGSVKAHRSVLACVSPVFRAMFQHDMKEQLTSSVDILYMSIDALQLFLLLLYTNPATKEEAENACSQDWMLEFSPAIDKHFVEIYEAVRKYQVESRLGSVLISALVRNLTPDNCWYYYKNSLLANPTAYKINACSVCYDYILGNYHEVIKSKSFLEEMRCNTERVHWVILQAECLASRELALEMFQREKRLRTG